MTERNTIRRYKTLIQELLEAKLRKIPQQFKALIPNHLSPEEKLVWIENAEIKVMVNGTSYTVYRIPGKPLGSGPYTGPGTAPGTGPGTELMESLFEDNRMETPASLIPAAMAGLPQSEKPIQEIKKVEYESLKIKRNIYLFRPVNDLENDQ